MRFSIQLNTVVVYSAKWNILLNQITRHPSTLIFTHVSGRMGSGISNTPQPSAMTHLKPHCPSAWIIAQSKIHAFRLYCACTLFDYDPFETIHPPTWIITQSKINAFQLNSTCIFVVNRRAADVDRDDKDPDVRWPAGPSWRREHAHAQWGPTLRRPGALDSLHQVRHFYFFK